MEVTSAQGMQPRGTSARETYASRSNLVGRLYASTCFRFYCDRYVHISAFLENLSFAFFFLLCEPALGTLSGNALTLKIARLRFHFKTRLRCNEIFSWQMTRESFSNRDRKCFPRDQNLVQKIFHFFATNICSKYIFRFEIFGISFYIFIFQGKYFSSEFDDQNEGFFF